jgi:repressor LexA
MLTQQQTKILKFICKSIEGEGFPPTLKEIGEAHYLSITQARGELLELERFGFIKRRKQCPRSIKVIRRPDEAKAAA